MAKHIGITCSFTESSVGEQNRISLQRYVDAVGDAGGVGEILWLDADRDNEEFAAQLAARLDGLIISGGRDLQPAAYGEVELPEAGLRLVPPERPAFERALLPGFLGHDKPVFGICYGCQFLNVWSGGALIQDIALQMPHAMDHRDTRHDVEVVSGSHLHRITGLDSFETVSSHHQALARLAAGACAGSHAADGIVETLEFPGARFLCGVQWHPECDRESEATRRLFEALVKACP